MLHFSARRGIMVLMLGAIVQSCAPAPPPVLESLDDDTKDFLFSSVDRGAAFLGQPIGGLLNCNPSMSAQGYVFRHDETGEKVWIDSLRPSGNITHDITSITVDGDRIDVEAHNGANIAFSLIINKVDAHTADISWDGAQSSLYRRCRMR